MPIAGDGPGGSTIYGYTVTPVWCLLQFKVKLCWSGSTAQATMIIQKVTEKLVPCVPQDVAERLGLRFVEAPVVVDKGSEL